MMALSVLWALLMGREVAVLIQEAPGLTGRQVLMEVQPDHPVQQQVVQEHQGQQPAEVQRVVPPLQGQQLVVGQRLGPLMAQMVEVVQIHQVLPILVVQEDQTGHQGLIVQVARALRVE